MADKKISQLTPTTTVDLADQYAIARGSGNFHVSYNTLKTELSVNTSSFVKTVNAVAPDSVGNVTVSLTAVETGTSASMIAYSSSGLFSEGDVWVISGESGSASGSNGDSYIYSGENTLLRLSGPDTAANDARYVNVSGDTMTGDLILNGAPTTNNQAATKAYVDGLTTNGTDGQTIRFNGTTPTANSFLYNSGTQVAVGTTSPDAGRVFTVSDETSGDPQVQIHGGTTQATSPGLEFEGSSFGAVLWMDSTDGHFNFGSRASFPDRTRRVSAADPVDSHNLTTKNYVDTSTANSNYVAVTGDTMTGALTISETGNALVVGDGTTSADTHIIVERNFGRSGSIKFTRDESNDERTDAIIEVDQNESLQIKYNQSSDVNNRSFRIINDTTNVMEVTGTGTDVDFTGNLTIANGAPFLTLNDNADVNGAAYIRFQGNGSSTGDVGMLSSTTDDITLRATRGNGNAVIESEGTGQVQLRGGDFVSSTLTRINGSGGCTMEFENTAGDTVQLGLADDGKGWFAGNGQFEWNNTRLIEVVDPVNAQDAATKNYADNVVYTAPVMFSGTGTGTDGNYAAGAKLQFNVDVDTNSGWSTDTYTIPEDGVYEIITSLRTRIETDDRRSAIYKGTGHIRIIENPQGATTGVYRSRTGVGHIITSLVTGDTISVGAFQTTTNYPNVSENGLSIRKLRN